MHVYCGYILWQVCELTMGMIKFELFGPKFYLFGPLWDFGAAFGGARLGNRRPLYGIQRPPQ
jgi:hypothetical protein